MDGTARLPAKLAVYRLQNGSICNLKTGTLLAVARSRPTVGKLFPDTFRRLSRLGDALCCRPPMLPACMLQTVFGFLPEPASFSLNLADFFRADRNREMILGHIVLLN